MDARRRRADRCRLACIRVCDVLNCHCNVIEGRLPVVVATNAGSRVGGVCRRRCVRLVLDEAVGVLGTNSACSRWGLAACRRRSAATALRWELVARTIPTTARRRRYQQPSLLAAPLTLDPVESYLLRCACLIFRGWRCTHASHAGGGIRCCFMNHPDSHGRRRTRLRPLEPWSRRDRTGIRGGQRHRSDGLARVMVLPRNIWGARRLPMSPQRSRQTYELEYQSFSTSGSIIAIALPPTEIRGTCSQTTLPYLHVPSVPGATLPCSWAG